MSVQINGTNGLVFADGSTQKTAANGSFKNRIINGAMQIDQRNAGASVTPIDNAYTLDRWKSKLTQASKYSVQQNAGAVTPPAGFTKYLGVTSLSAYSITSTDRFGLQHPIEGFNTADLGWGTANAKTITVSFQVYSSLTGTFGASLFNDGANRSYPFTYSIPVANTWTTISVTVAGDTTGTWVTGNTVGLYVEFSLGTGSTLSGTAGAWAGAFYPSATGATSVVGTNGATFYITGVQLEKGSTATSFDYRPYGTELALCQRYFQTTYWDVAVAGSSSNGAVTWWAQSANGSVYNCHWASFPVRMRASPSTTIYNAVTGATNSVRNFDSGTNLAGTVVASNPNGMCGGVNNVSVLYSSGLGFHYTASAEL